MSWSSTSHYPIDCCPYNAFSYPWMPAFIFLAICDLQQLLLAFYALMVLTVYMSLSVKVKLLLCTILHRSESLFILLVQHSSFPHCWWTLVGLSDGVNFKKGKVSQEQVTPKQGPIIWKSWLNTFDYCLDKILW